MHSSSLSAAAFAPHGVGWDSLQVRLGYPFSCCPGREWRRGLTRHRPSNLPQAWCLPGLSCRRELAFHLRVDQLCKLSEGDGARTEAASSLGSTQVVKQAAWSMK